MAPLSEPQLTPTGYTLLGLLSFGRELSGYELRKWGENLRFFWTAPAMSQVYREVERLAIAGYVEQRHVVRDGTRRTKVYRLTPAGRSVLRGWLLEMPEPPALKHPTALRVFFGHLLDADELRSALEAHRRWCEQMLDELSAVRRDIGEDPLFRNAALVAEWGLGYYRGELDAAQGIERAVTRADAKVAPADDEPRGEPGGAPGEGPDEAAESDESDDELGGEGSGAAAG